jgi:glutaminyl-tRNA synthetase
VSSKLKQLVLDKHVRGWDDPRLFTLNGLRRRGYTASAINMFCDRVGVSRTANTIEIQQLEACAREDLGAIAARAMVVQDPVRVVVSDWPEGKVEMVEAQTLAKDGTKHKVPFSRILFIEADDVRVDGAEEKDFFGLTPKQPVRLKVRNTQTDTERRGERGRRRYKTDGLTD